MTGSRVPDQSTADFVGAVAGTVHAIWLWWFAAISRIPSHGECSGRDV